MILIVDCGSKHLKHIEHCVDEFDDFQTLSINDIENITDEFSGVIISGAPILITEQDMEPILFASKWIHDINVPILGICFGHQLIGLHFGAIPSKMREDRDWQLIECFEDSRLFERLPQEFKMMEDHCETISIPGGFKLVASSDACVNEAMEHNTKTIFGVQFHPEISGNLGRTLIDNFIRICNQ